MLPVAQSPLPGRFYGNPQSLDDVNNPGPIIAFFSIIDEWAGQGGNRNDGLGPGLDRLINQNFVSLNPLDFWRERPGNLRNFD